ncbi:iron-regulated protein A [Agarivorans sp. Toyoura001]|uniref:imelysin family protein n=1 Tax=Agarivorans sp. Toyoura001 TaxID=2283141 RepID=UPI0010DE1944|nr:imelysin family protein [Agarivorans sp. Toyoura001]GDY24733.1 iron-regulated protein A [Agarivorans sp. Toyoura001]
MNKQFLRGLTLGVLGVLGLSCASAYAKTSQTEWLQQEQISIAKASANLLEQAHSYQQQVERYCAEPSVQGLLNTQQMWKQNYLAYLPLQSSALGPLVDLKLNWAISYWPDKKDTTGRKVKAALSNAPAPLSDTHSNLRVHEYLLFEAISDHQRCSLLPGTISRYVSAIEQVHGGLQSSELAALEIAQLRSDVLNSYRLQTSVMLRKYRAMYSAKHQRLRPYQGEAWRADISAQLLAEQLVLLHNRYEQDLALYLSSVDAKLAKQVSGQFNDLVPLMPSQEPSGDNASLEAWQLAEPKLAKLDSLFANQIPQALEIELGFNNNDGD